MNAFRIKVLVILLFLLSLCGTLVLNSDLTKPKASPSVIIKSVSEDELVLITAADVEYKSELSSFLAGKNEHLKSLIEAGSPFCVFVRNATDKDIVGLSLQWKIVNPDGSSTTVGQSYSSPGILMGLRPLDSAMIGHTSLVNAKASGFFSFDADLKQLIDRFTKSFTRGALLTAEEKTQLAGLIRHSRSQRNELIQPGSTIIVSVDGLIFSDGSFFGPDKNRLIVGTKALVTAKRDLGKMIDHEAKVYTNSDALIDKVLELAELRLLKSADGMSSDDADFRQLYMKYWKISVDELSDIRAARGSSEAIRYSQEAFHREWPTLHAKKRD